MSPVELPDLYHGDPVALTARVHALAGPLEITGMIGDRPWAVTLPLAQRRGKGIAKLWARRKITDAEVAADAGKLSSDDADRQILSLALEHHLVTRLTSLVAVDETPSRPRARRLSRADVRSIFRPAGISTSCSASSARRRRRPIPAAPSAMAPGRLRSPPMRP